ncbi:hypothetical protein [Candidatus Methylacidithermus pantelleriae]|uniref:Transposase n=1 Tax=Candidatus Methylacidithermus pantelleriae TaxID=2744239 RepID=A0A8J2BRX0_9BACT|nr:hypothetical protein [Candidatus Methylacidithermus pantelleriae]CAF0702664.1 hypothetical protein MPNT_50150 [Candidatus Methylacidithermus pantelleriae]
MAWASGRKAKLRLATIDACTASVRCHAMDKATTGLAKTWRRIGIEDRNVQGIVRKHCLSRSILDGALSEFGRPLSYKGQL